MKQKITKMALDRLVRESQDASNSKREFVWDTEVPGFGVKTTRTKGLVYVFQYRARSQSSKTAPRRLTLGRHGELTPTQARSLAAKLLLEVRSGRDPGERLRSSDAPLVSQLAARFLSEYLPNKKRPPRASTRADYERLFRLHILPTLGKREVAGVTVADVESLHQAMVATPYFANRMLSVLRQAFGQAIRWGWREPADNPVAHVERYQEPRRGAKKEVMLSAEQMRALLDAIREERSASGDVATVAIEVIFWTGWRSSEVLLLQWENVDLERRRAKLLLTKTAGEEYRVLPEVVVPLLKSLPRVAGCSYVFPGRNLVGPRTTVRGPWGRIRRRARLDGLEVLGPLRLHDLRHNVVSWDVSRGVPLEIAGKNVGHRSREATEVYAHFAPDALKRAADERAEAMSNAVGTARSVGERESR